MRLIDADALIDSLNIRSATYNCIINKCIEDAPTIDAVPVVRCKDCEYAVGQSFEGYLHCDVLKILIYETGYCCYGVRR